MKKLFTVFLSILLILFSLNAYAADELTVYCPDLTVKPGASVSFPVYISGNPGLCSWQLVIKWDSSALSIVSGTEKCGDDFSGGMFVSNSNEPGSLSTAWIRLDSADSDGIIQSFTLSAPADAKPAKYTVSITASGFSDENGNSFVPVTVSGSVTVASSASADPDTSNKPKDNSAAEKAVKETVNIVTVSESAASDAISWAKTNGITIATSGRNFDSSKVCTRAQMITMMWRAAGCPESDSGNNLKDIRSYSFCEKAVLWAAEQKIIDVSSSKMFRPAEPVTQAQAISFLWKAAGCPEASADKTVYENSIDWASNHSVIDNSSEINSSGLCSKGLIISYIYRAEQSY